MPLNFGFEDAVTRFAFSSNLSALLMGSLVLLSSVASAAPAPKILVIGDSLSAAYGLNMEQGWVSLLE